jgi:hypothetical protein
MTDNVFMALTYPVPNVGDISKNQPGFHEDEKLIQLAQHFLTDCQAFVETGTNFGITARHVATRFVDMPVFTCEPEAATRAFALQHLSDCPNVEMFEEASPKFLSSLFNKHPHLADQLCFFHLDAHGNGFNWPLGDEIRILSEHLPVGVMLVDDFRVPGRPEFKFDIWGGQLCNMDLLLANLKSGKKYLILYPKYQGITAKGPLAGACFVVWGVDNIHIPADIAPNWQALVVDKA